MRIISVQPAARRGGPSIQHLNFARESIAQGVEHHAIVRQDHEMLAEYREVFASVTTFAPVNAIVPRTLSPRRLRTFAKLVRELSDEFATAATEVSADLFWTVNDAFLPGPIAARKAAVPSMVHFLGMTSYTPRPVGMALLAFHRRYTHGIVACQDLIARDLAALGYPKERIGIVYNGIDVDRFAGTAKGALEEEEDVTVGMVGNLDRRKGLMLFIEAAARVRDSAPSTRFRIVGDLQGDPVYLEEIRESITRLSLEEHVALDGIVSDMPSWFGKLDIACVPSLIEALSVACLEEMAAALPVVATDVGGNSLAVKHGVNGLLSRAADPDDLAKCLLELVNSPETRREYGMAGQRLAKSTFSLDGVVKVLNENFARHARTA